MFHAARIHCIWLRKTGVADTLAFQLTPVLNCIVEAVLRHIWASFFTTSLPKFLYLSGLKPTVSWGDCCCRNSYELSYVNKV